MDPYQDADDFDDLFAIGDEAETTPVAEPEQLLKAGHSIYYSDPEFPDPQLVVREDPDGTKTLLRLNLGGAEGEEFEVLETL